MSVSRYKKILKDFKKYSFINIESGASLKKFNRLKKGKQTFILIDFNEDRSEYLNYLNITKILKNIDISIPNIVEAIDNELIILIEDFGDLRFDKILHNFSLKDLLFYAVETQVIIKNSLKYDKKSDLHQYNFQTLLNEVNELPDYYFIKKGLCDKDLKIEFNNIWLDAFNKINFDFESFTHKDFNLNNLILLPDRKDYLKCGVIDYQNSFWGDSSWDLFSLLEDSRLLFSDEFNNYFIKYFYNKAKLPISLKEFKINFHFLNISRQSRLLGRWVKLSDQLNQSWYLDFIPITKKRLKKSIDFIDDKNLNKFYYKYIFN